MHVLLPDTSGHVHSEGHTQSDDTHQRGEHVPVHLACLIVKQIHIGGNPADDPHAEPIEGCSVELGSNVAGGAHVNLPKGFFNLTPVVESGVDLGSNAHVTSRIRLDAGKLSHRKGLAKWNVPGHKDPEPLANTARWTVKHVPGGTLTVILRDLKTGSVKKEFNMVPDGDDTITLFIGHMPKEEWTMDPCTDPEPPKDPCPTHVLAYYSLFVDPKTKPVPCLVRGSTFDLPTTVDDGDDNDDECNKFRADGITGRTFSCYNMAAEAI
jgi:hypothetical protein